MNQRIPSSKSYENLISKWQIVIWLSYISRMQKKSYPEKAIRQIYFIMAHDLTDQKTHTPSFTWIAKHIAHFFGRKYARFRTKKEIHRVRTFLNNLYHIEFHLDTYNPQQHTPHILHCGDQEKFITSRLHLTEPSYPSVRWFNVSF